MFKVSLLPDSYRRHLENKAKVDFASRVALVVLVCLAIVLGGVLIKGTILNSKLEKIETKNEELEAQFPALQEYQKIYNDLQTAQKMIESISPKDPEAVEFLTIVSNKTPDYVQVTQIDLENWFTAGMCTLTCQVQDYQDVQDYKAVFETEEMKEFVKLVQITSIKRTVDTDGNKSVTFTIVLSMSNAVQATTQSPQIENANSTTAAETKKNSSSDKKEVTTSTTSSSGETTTAGSSETTTKKGD